MKRLPISQSHAILTVPSAQVESKSPQPLTPLSSPQILRADEALCGREAQLQPGFHPAYLYTLQGLPKAEESGATNSQTPIWFMK